MSLNANFSPSCLQVTKGIALTGIIPMSEQKNKKLTLTSASKAAGQGAKKEGQDPISLNEMIQEAGLRQDFIVEKLGYKHRSSWLKKRKNPLSFTVDELMLLSDLLGYSPGQVWQAVFGSENAAPIEQPSRSPGSFTIEELGLIARLLGSSAENLWKTAQEGWPWEEKQSLSAKEREENMKRKSGSKKTTKE